MEEISHLGENFVAELGVLTFDLVDVWLMVPCVLLIKCSEQIIATENTSFHPKGCFFFCKEIPLFQGNLGR